MIANLLEIEIVRHAGADRQDQRLNLGVLQHLVDPGLLDVHDLAPDRQYRLGTRVSGVLGGSESGKTLDDE